VVGFSCVHANYVRQVALLGCRATGAQPSLRVAHPDDATKQVEYYVERPPGTGPWPAVVLLHGHQDGVGPLGTPGGKEFADWGVLKQLAARGYLAVAVSQPGYGRSSGPADFCGPLHAARGRRRDRGALTAGLVAAHDSSIAGLVLISGVYSVLGVAGAIRAATLVLNGAQDERTSADQARALAAATRVVRHPAITRLLVCLWGCRERADRRRRD
jgi:hypothetical protein